MVNRTMSPTFAGSVSPFTRSAALQSTTVTSPVSETVPSTTAPGATSPPLTPAPLPADTSFAAYSIAIVIRSPIARRALRTAPVAYFPRRSRRSPSSPARIVTTMSPRVPSSATTTPREARCRHFSMNAS